MKTKCPSFISLLLATILLTNCNKTNTLITPASPTPAGVVLGSGPGYYCSAPLPDGDTIKTFTTTWTVPSTPLRDSTIFWWNALDGGAIQPVLSWENGSWFIQNWYFTNNYHNGNSVAVTPGTQLTGVIELVSYTNKSFTYKESFTGYPDADVTFTRPTLASSFAMCMEAYSNTYLAFPGDDHITMSNIYYTTTAGKKKFITDWAIDPGSAVTTPSGKNTIIVSDGQGGADIDFYFR